MRRPIGMNTWALARSSMKRFWITIARWGHLPFLVVWIYGMWNVFSTLTSLYVFISITLVSVFILLFLKVLIHAPRPFLVHHLKAPFWVPKHDSFPSGHAWMLATGTSILVAQTGFSVVGLCACTIGILVSYARFRCGVHRIPEVLVGYTGGILVSILALSALGVSLL